MCMKTRWLFLVLLLSLPLMSVSTLRAATELPADFTVLYSADERGEVEPCG